MIRTAIWTTLAWLVVSATGAWAYTVGVTSSPTGAEVWASPVDQPIIYKKGVTPCEVALDEAGAPHVIIVRAPGRFDAFREVDATGSLSVTLAARDDPAAWAQLSTVARVHLPSGDRISDMVSRLCLDPPLGLWRGRDANPQPIEGLPSFVDRLDQWAPDASGFLARGGVEGECAEELGLVGKREERLVSDIWWCPLQGEAVMLWRWTSESNVMSGFIMTGDVAPDSRWLVFSAAEGEREHVRLGCSADGSSRAIAAEDDATIYGPFFSPSGRLVCCIREQKLEDRRSREDPPSELQVMHFNGSGRRTVARGVDWHCDQTFSPDERHIAFVDTEGRVCVAPVAGGEQRVVISDERWAVASRPIWSPDGRRLAVTCNLGRGGVGMSRGRGIQRTCWADLDGEKRGFIRACWVMGWYDDRSLIVSMDGYEVERGVEYSRVGIVGLDGSLIKILMGRNSSDGPRGPLSALAPTIPTGGER